MKLHQRLDQEAESLWADRDVNRLLAHYRPYAERIASKRAAKQRLVDPEEYQQEALIGLWEAIEAFDPGECTAFTTFAMYRVIGRLVEAERSNDWVKPKVRAASNAGDISLPAMLRLKETFDTSRGAAEPNELTDAFALLMSKAKPRVVNIVATYLDADCDEDAAAAVLNVKAEYFGRVLLPDAINELRGIPCRT